MRLDAGTVSTVQLFTSGPKQDGYHHFPFPKTCTIPREYGPVVDQTFDPLMRFSRAFTDSNSAAERWSVQYQESSNLLKKTNAVGKQKLVWRSNKGWQCELILQASRIENCYCIIQDLQDDSTCDLSSSSQRDANCQLLAKCSQQNTE